MLKRILYISSVSTSLVISILSAALSVTTFILTYPKLKREVKGRLKIKAGVSEDKKQILIRLANASFSRVIKILEFEIYYGSLPGFKQLVVRIPLEPVTLTESDTFNYSVDSVLLKRGASENKVIQKYYSILWIQVVTAVSGSPLEKVILPENYFKDNRYPEAAKYMAADDLLGFPLMKPLPNTSTGSLRNKFHK